MTDVEDAAKAYRDAKAAWRRLAAQYKQLEEQRDNLEVEIEQLGELLRAAQDRENDARKALLIVAEQNGTGT